MKKIAKYLIIIVSLFYSGLVSGNENILSLYNDVDIVLDNFKFGILEGNKTRTVFDGRQPAIISLNKVTTRSSFSLDFGGYHNEIFQLVETETVVNGSAISLMFFGKGKNKNTCIVSLILNTIDNVGKLEISVNDYSKGKEHKKIFSSTFESNIITESIHLDILPNVRQLKFLYLKQTIEDKKTKKDKVIFDSYNNTFITFDNINGENYATIDIKGRERVTIVTSKYRYKFNTTSGVAALYIIDGDYTIIINNYHFTNKSYSLHKKGDLIEFQDLEKGYKNPLAERFSKKELGQMSLVKINEPVDLDFLASYLQFDRTILEKWNYDYIDFLLNFKSGDVYVLKLPKEKMDIFLQNKGHIMQMSRKKLNTTN